MNTFEEVSSFIFNHICKSPVCVETGTAYCRPPDDPYWNTTSALVKRICEPLNGHLYSVDIEDRSEFIKELFLAGNTDITRVSLLQGNSPDILKALQVDHIDLLCLDSGEDEKLLVDEFNAVRAKLSEKHYVLVDDIHNPNSVKYKQIVPLLKELKYQWIEIPTPTGLFLSSLGYPLPGV